MPIHVKRAYEQPSLEDEYRVLVDRIWPCGLSNNAMKIDEWLKEIAPSNRLRKAFHEGELTRSKFRNAYLSELKCHREDFRRVVQISKDGSAR